MEESKRKMRLLNRRIRLLLITLAVFLVFLWLTSAAGTAYAAGDSGTESLTPGEGGGHVPPPHTIEGWVCDYQTWQPVSGINVYLSWGIPPGFCPCDYTLTPVVTDSSGHFQFNSSSIQSYNSYGIEPCKSYYICVNGMWDIINGIETLGYQCDNPIWCQWFGNVTTDSNAYAVKYIRLDRSAIVNVPAAAIFSNTQYATVYYGTQTSQGFSHSLSFSVPILGISVGYETSESVAYTALFWSSPNHAQYVNRPYYASTYFNAIVGNVVSTGIAQEVPNTWWGGLSTNEYLNKTSLPTTEYVDFPVPPGGADWTYQEAGSTTWSVDFNVPFAIIYEAFNRIIKIDTSVTITSGTTTWVRYRIENPTENDIYFRV